MYIFLLEFVWKGFSVIRESDSGHGWTYWIWAPLPCAVLQGLEGVENQFYIEKVEPCVRPNGASGYNIYVQHNRETQFHLTHSNVVTVQQ